MYTVGLKALATATTKTENELVEMGDAVRDNEDALKKGKKIGAEYWEAIKEVTEEANDAFGDNGTITEELVDSNLEAFIDYANGVEGSDEKIR
jgi:hypothetical protein